MSRPSHFYWIFVCGLFGIGPAVSAEETSAETQGHLLRYKFQAGQVVHYETQHSATIRTTKGDLTETASNKSETEQHFRVVSVDDAGNATLELVIDRAKMSARFGDTEPRTFDSSNPTKIAPVYGRVAQAIGRPLAQVQVSPTGELLGSRPLLPANLQAEVAAAVPSSGKEDDPSKNVLLVLPEKPLQVGDEWRETFKVRVNVSRALTQDVTLLRTHTLTAVKEGIVSIRVVTSVITPIDDGGIRVQLIQRATSGTVEFDLDRGLIRSRVLTVDRTEVGVIGNDSTMQAVSRHEERLIEG